MEGRVTASADTGDTASTAPIEASREALVTGEGEPGEAGGGVAGGASKKKKMLPPANHAVC